MRKIFILSWPSWVGKTTLWEYLKDKIPNVEKIITTTTRKKRNYEQNGKDYYFVTVEEFMKLIKDGKLIEYAKVHGNFYGSTYDELKRILNLWKIPLYIVDPQWVKFLKTKLSWLYDVKTIFILPPSKEELKKRLLKRWEDENSDSFKIRFAESLIWLSEKDNYDYQIINDDLEKAANQLKKIFLS